MPSQQSVATCACQYCACPCCQRMSAPKGRTLRWSPRPAAIFAGSVVGIATWALLYVVGGAIAAASFGAASTRLPLAVVALGAYGAIAANAALYVGAFVTSFCGGPPTLAAGAVYGLILSGLANITLVSTAALLTFEVAEPLGGPVGMVVQVGAAAIGLGTSNTASLLAMATVMAASIACGAAGGRHGARFVAPCDA